MTKKHQLNDGQNSKGRARLKEARNASSAHWEAKRNSGNTKVVREAKSGRFVDGVKMVAKRDREGLIKLADR